MANRSLHCESVHNRLTMAASDNPEVGTVYSTDYGGDDCISTVSSMSVIRNKLKTLRADRVQMFVNKTQDVPAPRGPVRTR